MSITIDYPEAEEFDSAEHPERAVPKCFIGGPGMRMRLWEADEWRRRFGTFGCLGASHMWQAWETRGFETDAETGYCQAVVASADLRCDCVWRYRNADERCLCVGDLVYRGACTWCDWEAENFWDDENQAAEDALDHAWPGWRDLPVLDEPPNDYGNSKSAKKKRHAWLEKAEHLYPEGWIAQGGPIKTWRKRGGCRHVPGRSGFGGYDVGVLRDSQ